MNRKIILSKKASHKLEKLLEHLEHEWSIKVKREFIERLDKCLSIISKDPECFEKSHYLKGLHRCVITKQSSIYYKFDSERIFIITIFDNRQNPKRLKKEIK